MSSDPVPPPPSRRLAEALAEHRRQHNQSLGDLSRATGLSKTSLLRLEAGDGNPSLETLWRLGRALGLSIGQLLEAPEPAPTRLLRRGDGPVVESSLGMRGRLLHSDTAQTRTEVFELALPAAARFEGEPHPAGTRELVHCVEGTVLCGPDDDLLTLGVGDTASFDGARAHTYAGGPDGGRAVLVMSYPVR